MHKWTYKVSLYLFLSILLFKGSLSAMVDSVDYSAGISAQKRGDFRTAQEKLTIAFKKNGDDLLVRLAYASVAPCSVAIPMYKSIAGQTIANDTVRAMAYVKLGDYSYTQKEYAKSVEYYRCASKYGKKSMYRHYWALALLASGDEEAARSLWNTLSTESGDEISFIAQYQLGILNLKQKKYQDALTAFSKTGTVVPERPWAIAAIAGKIECARKLGMADKVEQFETQLLPYRKLLLDENYLKNIQSITKKVDSIPVNAAGIDTLEDTTDEKQDSLKCK